MKNITLILFLLITSLSNLYSQNRTEPDAQLISAYLPGQWKVIKMTSKRVYLKRTHDIFSVGQYYIITREGTFATKTVNSKTSTSRRDGNLKRCGNYIAPRGTLSSSGNWTIDDNNIFTTHFSSNSQPTPYYIIEVSQKHLILERQKIIRPRY